MILIDAIAGLEIIPFLQSGTAKNCLETAKLVVSHSDKLGIFRAVLGQRSILGMTVFTQECQSP